VPSSEVALAPLLGWGGAPEATVFTKAERLPAPNAALANGILAHTLDFDDTHTASITHPSACVVPAAVAAAEAAESSGTTLITSLVAGYEVTARIGLAASGAFHKRGFHGTPLCGAFGATAAAGKIYGLTVRELSHAFGIVGSQAAGIQAFLDDGSWTKRFHAGWAAHSGIMAAQLARAGFVGPTGVLENRFGFLSTHLGPTNFDASLLVEGLGVKWETLDLAIKPYPCCHFIHAFIDAGLHLRKVHGIAAVDIDSVEALVPEAEVPIVCEPMAVKMAPPTRFAALFSLPYCLAVALTRGHIGLDDFGEDEIRDPTIARLARRVSYGTVEAPRFPSVFPGTVRVHLRNGSTFERAEPVNRGHAENPLTSAEVRAKFTAVAGRALSSEGVGLLIAAVDRLEEGLTRNVTAEIATHVNVPLLAPVAAGSASGEVGDSLS
jgi:2-methylcitrate dehydratase PrpD